MWPNLLSLIWSLRMRGYGWHRLPKAEAPEHPCTSRAGKVVHWNGGAEDISDTKYISSSLPILSVGGCTGKRLRKNRMQLKPRLNT